MAGRSRIYSSLLALLVLLTTLDPASAQLIDMSGFLRSLYRDYLARDPSPEEMSAWVRSMQRGTPASEAHAYILASDECFVRNGRDIGTWITTAYANIVGRRPTPRDVGIWADRLNTLRGDRLAWSREFLRSADWQAPSFSRPPTVTPQQDLPTRLVTTCQLLSQAVQSELPGNRGWLAQTQANNLLTSAEANRFVLANPANNPAAFVQALTSLQTGTDALRGTLAQAGSLAPTSRQYADQVYQILAVIRDSVPTPLVLPPPVQLPQVPAIPVGGINQATVEQFLRRTDDLHRLTLQYESALKNVYPRDWTTDRLMRDAEEFHAGIDRFRIQVRPGTLRSELQASLANLRLQADRISAQVRQGQSQGNLDRRLVQAWYDTGTAFNSLAEYAGVGSTELIDPWQPIPWTSAGGDPLPVNLGGDIRPGGYQLLLRNLDEAIAQCDSLSAALTPYAFQSPFIPSVQSELRTLRNSILELRRGVSQNASRTQLTQLVNNVTEDTRRVESLWNRVLNTPGSLRADLPDLSGLRRALQQTSDPNLFQFQP